MVRRSTPQREIDDRSFPVRVFVATPKEGFGVLLGAGDRTTDTWLDREIGRGNHAKHGAGGRTIGAREFVSYYFRSPADAVRFLAAFPQLELADGTVHRGYTSPALPFGRT